MKYLLIEDSEEKAAAISDFVLLKDSLASIEHVDNLSDARICILTKKYDLIIFDVYLPNQKGEIEQDISAEIVADFSKSHNYYVETIAITKYVDEALERSPLFNDNGITLVSYLGGDGVADQQWKDSLAYKIRRISSRSRLDFVVFCALIKERIGYVNTAARIGDLKQIGGLNCQEIFIDKYRGMCITPSRMGLVNMAVASTKAIELFSPKIVAMSGICAGVEGESKLLDIVVGQICWEYQTGKFKEGKFRQEPYQVPMNTLLKTEIEQLAEQPEFVRNLKEGLFDTELKDSTVRVAPVSSGSVVIADAERMSAIGEQHRKWAALEMEMYSMYEAASQSLCAPLFFGAKAVVDMGDSAKGDSLHATACTISARFIVEVLKRKLPEVVAD